MWINYAELKEEWQEWCNQVWDFFMSNVVKNALWKLWNEICETNEKLQKNRNFNIQDPQHLYFIRMVADDLELSKKFLKYLRLYALKLKSLWHFQYSNQQIVWFLLSWENVKSSVKVSPEGIWSIFNYDVWPIIEDKGSQIALASEDKSKEVNLISALRHLTDRWYSPIDENGNVVYPQMWTELFETFTWVVNSKDNSFYCIDKIWKIIPSDTVPRLMKEEYTARRLFYIRCIDFFENNVLNGVTEKNIQKADMPTEQRNSIVLAYFNSQREKYNQKISNLSDFSEPDWKKDPTWTGVDYLSVVS